MRHICVTALCLSALSGSAFADPLQVTVYPFGQPAYQAQQPAPQQYYAAQPSQTYAATQPQTYAPPPSRGSLGGGFLEALFGGFKTPQQQMQPQTQPVPMQQQAYASANPQDEANYPIDPKFMRQVVAYDGNEQPGTIVVDTPDKFLYLVEDDGKALRYGIGVGRPGFTWSGTHTITAKKEWPDWTPPPEMLQRRPDLPRFMPGGIDNPLGARALYLGSTLYRIHGSNEPWTIGSNVSSGCIRMRNSDVEDLYNRVNVGTKVVVL